ncbi:MAG: 3-dehydroquinate synthase [Anaerolineae bacterium]|nr:3-dehydroquinate synthase [Anaerolineae bacterium]
MTQTIILTGFMGTGKSTIGRMLAARLNRPFVDTDDLIEQRSGKPISAIFADDGEAAFRAWEATIARELAAANNLVVATGGGFFTNPDNVALVQPKTTIICLSAEADTIYDRIKDNTNRPLLAVANPTRRITELLTARRTLYNQFPQIDTTGKSPAAIVEEIMPLVATYRPITVPHPTGSYQILVGNGAILSLHEIIGAKTTVAVISDDHVAPLYAAQVAGQFEQAHSFTVPAGEQFKTLATVNGLYSQLLDAGIDRQSVIIALGGGVVGDMAGFIAATYMRGIGFVQCPTTLLAMVDASIGGKTGVDLPQGKNLVGAFKQPLAVVADLDTLATLPEAELAAGMAEVVKHGLIAAPDLFAQLEQLESVDQPLLEKLPEIGRIVTTAIEVKRDIVTEDPFEQGRRAVLNLGHTFGHAIEQVSGYAVRHGAGVAMGLVAAANLSARLGLASAALQQRIEATLHHVKLPTRVPGYLDIDKLMVAMRSDKKKAQGTVRFILIRDVGDVFISAEVTDSAVRATWAAIRDD